MTAPISLRLLVERIAQVSAKVVGDPSIELSGVAPLGGANVSHLSFLANPRYAAQVPASGAGCVVLSEKDYAKLPSCPGKTFVLCDRPYVFFALAAQQFATAPAKPAFISPLASIDASAVLEPDVSVGPYAVITAGVRIGAGTNVGAHCFVGENCSIGEHSRLYPNVTIYEKCTVGAHCIIHSGVVIGADGFGFANNAGPWVKIPQTGAVLIGDDCEVGANTTIDRGAMSDTVIGNGVKIDNQVQVGHNVVIGDLCAIAGCVGIAGSTVIGKRCQIGGGAGILGHLRIADDVIISAVTTVTSNIDKPGFYTGIYPLEENASWERNAVLLRNLSKMRDQIKRLQARLDAMDEKKS